MNSMEKTREFLRSAGLPGGDAYGMQPGGEFGAREGRNPQNGFSGSEGMGPQSDFGTGSYDAVG